MLCAGKSRAVTVSGKKFRSASVSRSIRGLKLGQRGNTPAPPGSILDIRDVKLTYRKHTNNVRKVENLNTAIQNDYKLTKIFHLGTYLAKPCKAFDLQNLSLFYSLSPACNY